MKVEIKSFGFKYGEPYPETHLQIDLRNRIQNPQDHLPKGAVGTDTVVKKAVLGSDKNSKIFERYFDRVRKLMKKHDSLIVSFGCKSGIHRSVVFAEELSQRLSKDGHEVTLTHIHLRER